MSAPPSPEPALACTGLSTHIDGSRVLDDVSFSVRAGTLTTITGPNGAGKSTLLDAMAGARPVSSGSITHRTKAIAYVPQRSHVAERLPATVHDIVTVGAWGRAGAFRRLDLAARVAVADALDRLDLAPLARRSFAALSGGQRQRALLAQGLARGADLLLLDEPTTGLDASSSDRILTAIATERARGVAVVCATHDLALVARADQVLRLEDGRMLPHAATAGITPLHD